MTSRNALKIAAVAAAAVALSACSTSVSGQPVAVTGTSSATAASTPAALRPLRWKDVQAEAPEFDYDHVGSRFGSAVYPGIGVTQVGPDKSTMDCTAGPAVTGGVVVAGHCDKSPGGRVQVYPNAQGSSPIPIGVITDAVQQQVDPVEDFALLRTSALAPGSTKIAGQWAVAGVLAEEAAEQALPAGSPVCVNAAVTGVRCGAVLSTDDGDGEILFDVRTEIGDSGAMVFAVNADTNAATLIGIVRGGDKVTSTATYLAPALDKLHVSALVDPAAAVNPRTDPRYSRAVTTAQ
ncbi:hypothetical protein D2E65_16095 [Mycobacteroides abscessus]|uniref:hypothetical protein n=1 Tax=Mycobacteroides abscessus TaxID=36809 RepID=UPI000E693F7C|nr:hypothetical protein [Mycobacteroides abscessus]RIR77098.1 hypothetical protein D2E65_16095 [Mycobacteroides abscessus]